VRLVPFLGVPVRRGEIVRTRVPIGELVDGTPVALPVVTVGGARQGPTFYVQAGQHGDEATGIENCRAFLATLDPQRIAGTVVAVPIANVPSHITRTRGYLHEERWLIDMNRVYPGNPRGLLTERTAAVVMDEFVKHADLTVDLHSALEGCDIIPFASVDPPHDERGTLALRERVATSTGLPYVYYPARGHTTSDMSRAIGAQADAAGRAHVSMEMGESRRVSWKLVPAAVRALHNVMRVLRMEEGEPEVPTPPRALRGVRLVHAEHGGGLRLRVDLGDEVKEKQVIGEVVDVFGQRVEELVAPASGIVMRAMRLGSIATGAEVVWLAS
jgi:predicted deacylase